MEVLSALLYYLTFSLFAAIGLPLTSRFIQNSGLAWGTAKLIGFILFGYFIWILSFFRILNYQNYLLLLILFFLALASGAVFLLKFSKSAPPSFKNILTIEIISLSLYLLYLLLRSFNPSANGTEHFMDMALLTGAGKTSFFPFVDSWFAGKLVNYYYYGHYLMGLVANIGKISFGLAYNFALALIFSQSIVLSGLLVFAITKLKKYAILGGFLVAVAGTLFFAGCVTHGIFSWPPKDCSFASSTRLYTPSYIINEIPSYSFTVGNLHAHLINLPFFILTLILIYLLTLNPKPNFLNLALLSLAIATNGLANPWDLIVAASVFGVFVLWKSSKRWILYGAGAILFAFLLMLPANLNFSSPVLGVGFSPAYVRAYNLYNVQYPTPILAQAGMWGLFLSSILLAFILRKKEILNNFFLVSIVLVSIGILIGIELFFIRDIYSVANPSFFRANTTFKFGYSAWVMLAIAFSVCLAVISEALERKNKYLRATIMGVLGFLAIGGGLVYPFKAVKQYYAQVGDRQLDASVWMKKSNPDDWNVVQYINDNFDKRSVIAEAVGDSYSTFSRISTFTGMIAPMGWMTHEWTWRLDVEAAKKAMPGAPIETGWGAVSAVAQDIKLLYKTANKNEAKNIIDKYGIEYIYVGELERGLYGDINEAKLLALGSVMFKSGNSALFKVK